MRRLKLAALAGAMLLAGFVPTAEAQETVKVAFIAPMTGPFTTTGKMMEAGVRLYMQQPWVATASDATAATVARQMVRVFMVLLLLVCSGPVQWAVR